MKQKIKIFWGFVDEQGVIEVLPYKNDKIIRIYESMYFVKGIFDPFPAQDIWEARRMINLRYKQEFN